MQEEKHEACMQWTSVGSDRGSKWGSGLKRTETRDSACRCMGHVVGHHQVDVKTKGKNVLQASYQEIGGRTSGGPGNENFGVWNPSVECVYLACGLFAARDAHLTQTRLADQEIAEDRDSRSREMSRL